MQIAPVSSKEYAHNVRLNPMLSGFIPFDSQESVNAFLESPDRIVALQRYIKDQVPWEQSSFGRDMLRLICTREYRLAHAYPGGKTYKVSILKACLIIKRIFKANNFH